MMEPVTFSSTLKRDGAVHIHFSGSFIGFKSIFCAMFVYQQVLETGGQFTSHAVQHPC